LIFVPVNNSISSLTNRSFLVFSSFYGAFNSHYYFLQVSLWLLGYRATHRAKYLHFQTFMIGPMTLSRWPELPETELSGLAPLMDIFGLKEAMPWDTPGAKVNCSRSSTFVRPLAKNIFIYLFAKNILNLQRGGLAYLSFSVPLNSIVTSVDKKIC